MKHYKIADLTVSMEGSGKALQRRMEPYALPEDGKADITTISIDREEWTGTRWNIRTCHLTNGNTFRQAMPLPVNCWSSADSACIPGSLTKWQGGSVSRHLRYGQVYPHRSVAAVFWFRPSGYHQ
ncbi:hypothetical protein [Desulfotomaculum sp. 1211_IL3151]|uniref:hypothetical protein n=1 Tax=Desulfotomaculum sp. 1211_IL3151 TaxID=3084055 RepID=UPI002FD88DD5